MVTNVCNFHALDYLPDLPSPGGTAQLSTTNQGTWELTVGHRKALNCHQVVTQAVARNQIL